MRFYALALQALKVASIGVVSSSIAIAAEALPPRPFAFSTMGDPGKLKCIQIDVSALKCEQADLEVGHGQVCSKPDGKQAYLIFQSKVACEAERKGEAANND